MRISIVFSACHKPRDPGSLQKIRDLAPCWGSWKSWKDCDTHNVICHEVEHARKLLKRAVQAVCNFYIPQKLFLPLNRPINVQFYQGDFLEEADDIEDVVAMHLASSEADLVLLFGFDVSSPGNITDPLQRHRIRNRLGLIRQCIRSRDSVQWVLVDHAQDPDKAFRDIANLTRDELGNVLKLLSA